MKFLADRMAFLDEYTTIQGRVLDRLEAKNEFRSKNMRMLRAFVDACTEEYRKATVPPLAPLHIVRGEDIDINA